MMVGDMIPIRTPGHYLSPRLTRRLLGHITRQFGLEVEMIVWGGVSGSGRSLTQAADTILAQIVGQPPARLTRPTPETITRQCGLAVK